MRISAMPPLPVAPEGGKKKFSVEVSYVGPDTVKTRLGSIPRDFETSSGREKVVDIFFEDRPPEAANPSGRSREIWREQPLYTAAGEPRMKIVTETVTAAPYSKVKNTLGFGAAGAVVGGVVGGVVGLLAGNPLLGLQVGSGVLGTVGGGLGYFHAASDRVKLEWQETPIVEHKLIGYRYEVDEDTTTDSDGNTKTDDYEHEFRPLIAEKTVGTYQRPVVVHYSAYAREK